MQISRKIDTNIREKTYAPVAVCRCEWHRLRISKLTRYCDQMRKLGKEREPRPEGGNSLRLHNKSSRRIHE